ncbi:carboxypeptidase-like regulatory domain-containing protein [Neolewinella lacunae]|uniref:Carboxypeptidase-like regulatory domain-containing protein n=1 Tax=Neolewinella lacunae TaxID=1517758 RepID=A0A923PLA3_9BACT|nr:carboxypeptidase-like regulatory domain-containing protein [Neolewinella lacunae]MBC6995474.1 carboxypeptidase-like regulatory domain-containing protein [Neolewinella lacunae]MDN3635062.1 carboxypeptidase-like regulatory domain-containing protein [Neolewinella lacunae]
MQQWLLPILLLFSAIAVGQSFDFPATTTRIYPIPASTVGGLLSGQILAENLPDPGEPYPANTLHVDLPPGHYLEVRLSAENVAYEYFNTYRYTFSAEEHRGKFHLRVHDATGSPRSDAEVLADGHPVRYAKKHGAYRRRDWKIDEVRIVVDQDTLFYLVEEGFKKSRFRHDLSHVTRNIPAYVILTPYRITRNSYRYLKGGIAHGNWSMYNYPFRRTIQRTINPPRPVAGYVTTNQPKYRPTDTLRISAYLTKPSGRPLVADSIDLSIFLHRPYQRVLERKIGRTTRGRYELTMPLPAAWEMDRKYNIEFSLPGIMRREVSPDISFRLEDYELAEYELDVTASTDARLPGTAWLDLATKDSNGQPLPDGQLTLTVLLDRIAALADTVGLTLPDTLYTRVCNLIQNALTVTVPLEKLITTFKTSSYVFTREPKNGEQISRQITHPTLYTYREATDNRVKRRIVLPDSLFPAGYSLEVKVKTQLSGPSGEYVEKTSPLVVDRRFPQVPRLELDGPSLHLFLAPAAAPAPATLLTINAQGDTVVTAITLPHRLKLDHQQRQYTLQYQEQSVQQVLRKLRPTDEKLVRWAQDTLFIQFTNPHQQEVFWELRARTQVLGEGDGAKMDYVQAGFAPGTELQLRYRYLAGGTWVFGEETLVAPDPTLLSPDPQQLSIALEHPEKVRPGQTVRVALTATDQRGRPASGVRLTAATYNARFDGLPSSMPTYTTRQRPERQRQSYQIKDIHLKGNRVPPYWAITRTGLDTSLAYQLRYPTAEFSLLRSLDTIVPAGSPQAHFAPFILKDHRPIPLSLVYADDRLVYFHHPNITTPYSIPVDSGWHHIVLRTQHHRYEKDLYFPARQQSIVSFASEQWLAAGWQRTEMKKPTQEEVNSVHNRVFALTGMDAPGDFHFRTGGGTMIQSGRASRGGYWAPLGLATANNRIDFWMPNGDSVQLTYEPQALYQIKTERDRLYPLAPELILSTLRKPGEAPTSPGIPRYAYRRPEPAVMVKKIFSASEVPHRFPEETSGRLQVFGLPKEISRVIIAEVKQDRYYQLNLKQPNRLTPGWYDILYHFPNDSVRHQRIDLPPDSLLLLVYREGQTQFYSYFSEKEGYSEARPKYVAPVVHYPDFIFTGSVVSGRVVDQDGEPLAWATVLLEEMNTGVVTDVDGHFVIKVPSTPYTLRFLYTGFVQQQLVMSSPSLQGQYLEVIMEEGVNNLDAVVVSAFSVPSIEQDHTTVTSLAARVAGVEIADINLRSSRINAKDLFVDGLRVSSDEVPDSASSQTEDPALTGALLSVGNVRSNFADYAAFVPDLRTDARGRAEFDIHFPDDITAWNTLAVGQDRRRRVGLAQAQTMAFLPLQAQLYLPRFLVEGDESEALALAINREEAEKRVRFSFRGDGQAVQQRDSLLGRSLSFSYPILAAAGLDSMHYQFDLQSLASDGEGDGETRAVPVYPRGTEMVNGALLLFNDQEMILPDSFIDPARGPVTLRLPGNRLAQLLAEVDHLIEYPYECVEQTASRLIGLLALERIAKAGGKVAGPDPRINRMIRRLEKLRRDDGGFGWWGGSATASPWISNHVYTALAAANAQGYAVADQTGTRRYLLSEAAQLPVRDQLQIALTLAENGFPPTAAEMQRLDTFSRPNDYTLLAITRLQQLWGDTVDIQRLLDSSRQHAALGRYWGERRFQFYRQPLNDRLACGLMARRILSAAGRKAEADETVNYLLGQTATGAQRGSQPLLGANTLESARLVADLLPYLLAEDEVLAPPTVRITSKQGMVEAKDFPFQLTLAPEDVAGLKLQRTGSGPMPLALYQRWFETTPEASQRGFQLTARLTDHRTRVRAQLTKGKTAYLEVSLTSQADADYVLLEIPIPAGCSYHDREEPKGPFAVHREYRRDRVAIFCERLPAGTHTYRVALAPRFSGSYTINPPRAEMQYLPVVNGNGALREVFVE